MKIIVDKDDLICKLHLAFIALSHDYDAPGEREGVDEFCESKIEEAIEFYCNSCERDMSMEV